MEGWTVRVLCPHGVLHEMPLSWLYNMKPPVDMCPDGKREKMEAGLPLSRYQLWKETRRARKELREL